MEPLLGNSLLSQIYTRGIYQRSSYRSWSCADYFSQLRKGNRDDISTDQCINEHDPE